MFTYSQNLAYISSSLDEIFSSEYFNKRVYKYISPYTVTTDWINDEKISVSARGFYKVITAKDTIIDTLIGTGWESRVRNAQQKAFETAYMTVRKEEEHKYIIGKFK